MSSAHENMSPFIQSQHVVVVFHWLLGFESKINLWQRGVRRREQRASVFVCLFINKFLITCTGTSPRYWIIIVCGDSVSRVGGKLHASKWCRSRSTSIASCALVHIIWWKLWKLREWEFFLSLSVVAWENVVSWRKLLIGGIYFFYFFWLLVTH